MLCCDAFHWCGGFCSPKSRCNRILTRVPSEGNENPKKKQNKKIDEEEEEGKPGFPCGLTFNCDDQVCLRFPASFDLSATLS
jgi:hypothetical protein